MAAGTRTTAKNAVENEKTNSTPKEKKPQETANTETTEGKFIYIGPVSYTHLTLPTT